MSARGWQAIRAEVLARLHRRDWLPGALIPGEAELAAEFGCARATVNRALRDLAGAGYLERRRKAGTRVALHPVRKASFDIPVIRAEIEARGQVYGFQLLAQQVAMPPRDVGEALGAAFPMLHLRTLHLADGTAFVFEERWLNPGVLPAPAPDFGAISVNQWLVENVPYVTGDIAFYAEAAGPDAALALGIVPGAAVFVTERRTFGPGAPITHVRLTHAAGYRMHTAL